MGSVGKRMLRKEQPGRRRRGTQGRRIMDTIRENVQMLVGTTEEDAGGQRETDGPLW